MLQSYKSVQKNEVDIITGGEPRTTMKASSGK